MPTPEYKTGKNIVGIWNKSYLPITVRTFAFQLANNSLPVGARMGNRYKNDANMAIDVNCPFCSQNNFNLPIRETFRHLYFDCTVTSNIWQIFRTRYMQGSTVEHCTRQIFFGIMPNEEFLEIQLVISLLFLHCIWMCRLSRKISFTTVENNMAFYYKGIIESCKYLRVQALNSNSLWCREWTEARDEDG